MVKEISKVVKDGKVAVLYSPNYGAGWYTWNDKYLEILFDPDIVNLVLDDGELNYGEYRKTKFTEKVEELVNEKYDGNIYTGGSCKLDIYWVTQGEQFEVTEYDGYESVNVIGEVQYLIA